MVPVASTGRKVGRSPLGFDRRAAPLHGAGRFDRQESWAQPMNSNQHPRSQELYERACRVIPGGVNSPVRAFKAVGGTPLFIQRGARQHLVDADGRTYLDLVGSWGALILG